MRQRVMIAIALVLRPAADPLRRADDRARRDDPGPDPEAARARCAASSDVSLVFVTHDLAVVAQTCQRVAVMYAGQVVETGTVDEVFREPRHPYTLGPAALGAGLRRSCATRSASIPGAPPDLASPPPGCRFHPRCPFAQDDCMRRATSPLRPLERRTRADAPASTHERCRGRRSAARAGDRRWLSRSARGPRPRRCSFPLLGDARSSRRLPAARRRRCCARSTAST